MVNLLRWGKDRLHQAENIASKAYDQVNTGDNGLSWQTRQINPNVQPASVAKQVYRNPIVNGLVGMTGAPAAVDATRMLLNDTSYNMGLATGNRQAAANGLQARNAAAGRLGTNLPQFLPVALTESTKPFMQSVATALTNPYAEHVAEQEASRARDMLHTGDPAHDLAVDAYAESLKQQMYDSQLQGAGINPTDTTGQVSRKVGGQALTTAANISMGGALPGVVAARGAPQVIRNAGLFGTQNAAAAVGQVAQMNDPTLQEYLKEGAIAGAMGAALPLAPTAARAVFKGGKTVAGEYAHNMSQGGFLAGPEATGFQQAKAKGMVFEGPEGKPRFEGDDSGATVKNYDEALKSKTPTSNKGNIVKLRNEYANVSAVNPFDRRLPEILKEIESAQTSTVAKARVSLQDVLDHPALYEQYPQLRGVQVIKKNLKGADAHATVDDAGQPVIYLDSTKLKNHPESLKENLLHEITHVIQEKEGYAKGADPDAIEKRLLKEARDYTGEDRTIARDMAEGDAWDEYQRTAGEAEARAVAARADMPMKERYKPNDKVGQKDAYPSDFYNDFAQRNRQEATPFDFELMKNALDVNPETKGNMVKVYRLTDAKGKKLLPGDNVSVHDLRKINGETADKMGISALVRNPKKFHLLEQWIPKDDLYQSPAGTQVYAPKGVKSSAVKSTFYDSLDVPKNELIVRKSNDGTSAYIPIPGKDADYIKHVNELARGSKTPKDFTGKLRDVADLPENFKDSDFYQTVKKEVGLENTIRAKNPNLTVKPEDTPTTKQITLENIDQQSSKSFKDTGEKMFGSRKDKAKLARINMEDLPELEAQGERIADSMVTKQRVLGDDAKYTPNLKGDPAVEQVKHVIISAIPGKPAGAGPKARAVYTSLMPHLVKAVHAAPDMDSLKQVLDMFGNGPKDERGYTNYQYKRELKTLMGSKFYNVLNRNSLAIRKAIYDPATDFSWAEKKTVERTATATGKPTETIVALHPKNIRTATPEQAQAKSTLKTTVDSLKTDALKYESVDEFVRAKAGNNVYADDNSQSLGTNIPDATRIRGTGKPYDYTKPDPFFGRYYPETKGSKVKVYRVTDAKTLLPGDNLTIFDPRKLDTRQREAMGIPEVKGHMRVIEQWVPKKSMYGVEGGTQQYAPDGLGSLADVYNRAHEEAGVTTAKSQLKSMTSSLDAQKYATFDAFYKDYKPFFDDNNINQVQAKTVYDKAQNSPVAVSTAARTPQGSRPAAELQTEIEKAHNAGDDATAAKLIEQLPADMQDMMKSVLGWRPAKRPSTRSPKKSNVPSTT
jgi:hypothetical protein